MFFLTSSFDHYGLKPLRDYAFKIFGFEVKWYAIFIITGAVLALLYGLRIAKKINFKKDDLLDIFTYGLVVSIIGARLYYVIFSLDSYRGDWLSAFKIWEGGLAIHGAVIAAALFGYFFSVKRKYDPIKFAEIAAPGFLIGQIIGRFGNFVNQEATGPLIGNGTLDLDAQRAFLKIKLNLPDFIVNQMFINPGTDGVGYYHPTFLYEASWNFLGLAIILLLRKFWKKYWIGDALLFYMVWYSVGRFFIEGLRTDALMIGRLRQAQVISIVLFLAGIVLFILRRVFQFRPMNYQEEVEKFKGEIA